MPFVTQNLEINSLFPTPFVVLQLGGDDGANERLKARILARVESHPSVLKSNRGGWQSDTDFQDWAGPEGEALLAVASEIGTKISARQTADGFVPADFPWKVNAWANVNRAGNTNDMHTHAGAYWSGVYYVDDGGVEAGGVEAGGVEAGGALELMDPRGVMPMMYAPLVRIGIKGCLTAGGSETFQPRTGNMVLFPAWLFHAVQPYRGDGVRISVAFNLGV
ncbi:hypothetical protein GCM10011611_54300 [Aliidongia dinghuensis]|uniref:2OG-Fe(II) oxygenase n=1 Tax=Aliidongia dinghuensis TaxID=1867774 RepID=A0A8J3E4S0_9PROT|nr:2OG-Fe(II) oxygenase family protein [Aliidongia dinghuensis]GGF40984.1 hypothetical protein GCM10011611_54300 [Aliidongia dinghuensis]